MIINSAQQGVYTNAGRGMYSNIIAFGYPGKCAKSKSYEFRHLCIHPTLATSLRNLDLYYILIDDENL
jgi:hypothetical protein